MDICFISCRNILRSKMVVSYGSYMCNFSRTVSNEPQFTFHIIHKSKFKSLIDLNTKPKTTKLLEENLCGLYLEKYFIDKIPKA